MTSPSPLAREIDQTETGEANAAFWWLGQSGFAIKAGATVVYLDPYLSARLERITRDLPHKRHVRLCGIPIAPAEIKNADFVICSHNHGDHLDPETLGPLSEASPGAVFVVPRAAREFVVTLGIPRARVAAADAHRELDLGSLRLVGIPAKHNEFDRHEELGYPYLGYVIFLNGLVIYHAGDTLGYDGLAETVAAYRPDVALLPINGGDPDRVARGFMSNLNYKEAADLGAAVGARLVIPMHFGMFDVNNERAERFADYAAAAHPGMRFTVPVLGRRIIYERIA